MVIPPMTNHGTSTWVDVDGNFYRIVFGEEASTEEEEQMSPCERARRLSCAFARSSIGVTHWRGRKRRTRSTLRLRSPARESRPSLLSAASIAALVDVFRILQAWDNETRR